MDKSQAALGASATVNMCSTIDPDSLSPNDRILLLEEQMKHMQRILMRMKKAAANVARTRTASPASLMAHRRGETPGRRAERRPRASGSDARSR